MSCRTYPNNDYLGLSFLFTLLCILVISSLFIYEFLINPLVKPLMICFLIILLMVVWSLLATALTEPGKVPTYWGLTQSSNSSNQRKYCLLCHNFKPQRCHHCSTCRKCVLNMDHHCPWVNNCIGFHNRKFFLLFLFYLTLGLLLITTVSIIRIIEDIKEVIQTHKTDIHFALKALTLLAGAILSFMLGTFLSFHFDMVLKNTTTLEKMMVKRTKNEKNEKIKDYNIGKCENFMQVFGQNGFYWFVPLTGEGPKGDGTYWKTRGDDNEEYQLSTQY